MQSASLRRQADAKVVWVGLGLVLGLVGSGQIATASVDSSFVLFESGQVRPLAMSPDGTHLFAVDTPDNRLVVFSVDAGGLTKVGEVGVGMEPVAVAARSNTEVWVVNNLSDSISVVDVSGTPQVERTLLVGDEPRDIVFAGPGGNLAFITTARRGQNLPATVPALLTTPSTPRALVWVFDANNLDQGGGPTLAGVPLTIIPLFGDTPRALAVSPDGNTVYAAVFESGNQTATVNANVVCQDKNLSNNKPAGSCSPFGATMPGSLPNPEHSIDGDARPNVGLIVRYNGTDWVDGICAAGTRSGFECMTNSDCPASTCTLRNWDNGIQFTLPDLDVFKIDASQAMPIEISGGAYAHVGTILFNMVVNPQPPYNLYVSNTDAHNQMRFEGPGVTGKGSVHGHLHEARVSVLDPTSTTSVAHHLNKHIDYSVVPSPPGTADASLATPVGLAVSGDGGTLYVAGFGSQKIGVYNTSDLESDTFFPPFPSSANAVGVKYVSLAAGGPSGLALDENNSRLYVLTRFDNSVSVVNTATDPPTEEVGLKQPLYNPEPASVVEGRPFLYDAAHTSSNGEASCSSCHVFGDFDSLAWDLGNPDNTVANNPNPFRLEITQNPVFHPIKGPMTTLSLRGMANNGPMHWRGDRTAGNDPGGDPLDEAGGFAKFNPAFIDLIGSSQQLSTDDMAKFTAFVLQETYPPNPNHNLDNSLTTDQATGQNFYLTHTVDLLVCNGCHKLNEANNNFGTDGFSSFEGESQEFKIPHLRNLYQKVGMFGLPELQTSLPGTGLMGDQVRGFGFLHDGSIDDVFDFLHASVFNFDDGATGETERRQVEDFVLSMPSDLAPIVGQQVTLTSANNALSDVTDRLDLFDQRSQNGECDVIVKGFVGGQQRGWVRAFGGGGTYRSDRASEALLTAADLRLLSDSADLTYTAVPVGSGIRMGIDRDEDGYFDTDEVDAGTDPANPLSIPPTPTPTATGLVTGTATATVTSTPTPTVTATPTVGDVLITAKKLLIKNHLPDEPAKNKIVFLSASTSVPVPSPGSTQDPRCNTDPSGTVKASVTIASPGSAQSYTADLPCQNWKLLGSTTHPRGYKYSDPHLTSGAAKTVIWQDHKQLKATLLGKGSTPLSYDLQIGVSESPVGVRFTYSGNNICLGCMAFNGKDGSDGKEFLGKACSAPGGCIP